MAHSTVRAARNSQTPDLAPPSPSESLERLRALVDTEFQAIKLEATRRHPEVFDFGTSLVNSPPPPLVKTALMNGILCHKERTVGCKLNQRSSRAECKDPALAELKTQLARLKGGYFNQPINADNVVLANRFRSSLTHCLRCFLGRDQSVMIMPPCFGGYEIAIAAADIRVTRTPLVSLDGIHFTPDTPKVVAKIRSNDEKIGAVLISIPNNPTGESSPAADLKIIHSECVKKGIVLLIDDTFGAFRRGDLPPPRLDHSKVIYLGSFGESYGIPTDSVESLGYAISSPEIAAEIRTMSIADPPPTPFFQEVALLALQEHESHLNYILPRISQNQAYLRNLLSAHLPKLACSESMSLPFIYLHSPTLTGARSIAIELAKRAGVFVAPANAFGSRCAIRVGVGEILDQDKFQRGVKKMISSLKQLLA